MNAEQFVDVVRKVVLESAASGCVMNYQDPPGRAPSTELKVLSAWYKDLSEIDKTHVLAAMNDSAHSVLFGIFCVLDGVRAVENGNEKGTFELYFKTPSGQKTLVNSPSFADLHDLLNSY